MIRPASCPIESEIALMSSSPTANQKTGIAGEFFVAAELAKRNFQVAISLGNAKGVDLFVTTPDGKKTFEVEVKTLRKQPNCFTLNSNKVKPQSAYIFVYLNSDWQSPDYFILLGSDLLLNLAHFYGSSLGTERETVNHGPLKPYLNNWKILQ